MIGQINLEDQKLVWKRKIKKKLKENQVQEHMKNYLLVKKEN